MNTATTCLRRCWLAIALLVGLGLFALPDNARGQKLDDRSSGTTYVIAFPDTTMNTVDARFKPTIADTIMLMIYSAVDNEVNISSPVGYTNLVRPSAGVFEIVYLNSPSNRAAQPIVTQSGVVVNNTFRIEAKYPIIVYCYIMTKFGGEAWTPIPVESWGTEYYAAAHPGEAASDVSPGGETDYNAKNKMAPAEITIVAAFDNTKIAITPTIRTIWHNFPAMTQTLNAGQAYQVQSWVDTLTDNQGNRQPDLGGVYITSDKPIGVLSGNTRAQLNPTEQAGLARNTFKNLMIEWLAPQEQHGKYFVYLPTWDDRRITGQPGEKIQDKRPGEYVRVYGTSPGRTNGIMYDGGFGTPFSMANQDFYEARIGASVPRVFITDTAAQAYHAPIATTIFEGTTGSPGFLGARYSGYSTYMVEMTPREQWVNFAPYYAPQHPSQMEHFVNIVTDTNNKGKIFAENGSAVVFNRGTIAGTDLIWGSTSVTPGLDHFFRGANDSARFYAFVYGFWKGYELYRPGRTKKKDDDQGALAGGGGKGSNLLHPSEYEENIALSYGYPLAPSRIVLRPPDSLLIDTTMDCQELTVRIRAINERPVGFRSISLDPKNVVNARLVFIIPDKASDVIGKTEATVKIVPIDPLKDASATLIIKDRTGKTWLVEYKYEAERVDLIPRAIMNFGEVTQGECLDSVITITNPLNKTVQVKEVKLYFANQAFSIVGTTPTPLPVDLAAGASMVVNVRFCPTQENFEYVDTAIVKLGCTEVKLPLRGETVKPCIFVDDLDFGTFILGTDGPDSLKLEICNQGRGNIRFTNPSGGAVLTWLQTNFTVPQSTIDSLRDFVVLGANECISIWVTFTPTELGLFKTTAKFWSTTDCVRDTSIWTAYVTKPGPQITGHDWKEQWLVADPLNCSKNGLPYYEWVIDAFNTGNTDFVVASIVLEGTDAAAGIFKLDSSVSTQLISTGMRVNPIRTDVTPPDTPRIFQRVLFFPREQRAYTATVKLKSVAGDSAVAFLEGVGIESGVVVSGFDYDTTLFRGAGGSSIPAWVTIGSDSSRPLTVTDIQILPNNGNFRADFTGLPAYPFVIQPDDTLGFPVYFEPQTAGKQAAIVRIIGDHSACDLDSNTLVGFTYQLGATAEGFVFGNPLTCNEETGTISVSNSSNVAIYLSGSVLADATGYFTLVDPITPDTIEPMGRRTYRVKYAPGTEALPPTTHNATVTFELRNVEKDSVIGMPVAPLSGNAHKVTVNVDIANNYSAYPGKDLYIPMTLRESLDEAALTSLYITVRYNKGMMVLNNFNQLTQNSLLNGWTMQPGFTSEPGYFAAEFIAPAGQPLTGTGALLNMAYITFIGQSDTSAIDFTVEAIGSEQCVTILPDPGFAKLDSVCGLNFRLITASGKRYVLDQSKPNPFNPSTDIVFELGLDGPTTLVVYNALGEPVAKLVDGTLQPGTYTVTWDATAFPSGLYYYVLQSGDWSKTRTMILKK